MDTVRFGELYAIPSGNGLSRPSAVRGEGYRMIGMGELFASDIISDTEMDRVQMSERELKTFLVEEGDLLFARQSLVAEGAGKCSIVKRLSEPTTYESHLIRVRLDQKKCNPWFYYYLFKLPNNPIKAIVNQCAQAGIRGNELIKVKVPLLDRPIQDRITSILSVYDNLIEVNNKRIKVLEQMAENLYKEWFVRFRFPGHESVPFENGLPTSWRKARITDFVSFLNGFAFKSEDYDDAGRYIVATIKNVQDGYFDLSNVERIDFLPTRMPQYCMLKKGDVIMSLTGNVGRVCIVSSDGCLLNQRVCKIESKYPLFAYLFFRQEAVFQTLCNIAYGTAQLNLSPILTGRMRTVLPPEHLMACFDEKVSALYEQIQSYREQSEILIKQRDLLLPRLMSGRMEVNLEEQVNE